MSLFSRFRRLLAQGCLLALFGLIDSVAGAQPVPQADTQPELKTEAPAAAPTPPVLTGPLPNNRILGVLPNYRTAEVSAGFQRLTTKQKFTIAEKDSFDWPVFVTTAYFAGISHLQGTDNQTYGQGPKGYAYRYLVNYGDQVVGNFFPEAIVPMMFHSDPRYFRKGEGSKGSRVLWAVSRIFVCKNDNGNAMFNVNEFIGNGMAAVAVSSYHPHQRTLGDMVTQTGNYIETDMAGQILKEFWPDMRRVYNRWRHK